MAQNDRAQQRLDEALDALGLRRNIAATGSGFATASALAQAVRTTANGTAKEATADA